MDHEPIISDELLALARSLRGIRSVDVPGLGPVYIRRPTNDDMAVMSGTLVLQDGRADGIMALLAATVLCDAEGNRLFDTDDAPMLNATLSVQTLQAISAAVRAEDR